MQILIPDEKLFYPEQRSTDPRLSLFVRYLLVERQGYVCRQHRKHMPGERRKKIGRPEETSGRSIIRGDEMVWRAISACASEDARPNIIPLGCTQKSWRRASRRFPAPTETESDSVQSMQSGLMTGLRPSGIGLLFRWVYRTSSESGIDRAPAKTSGSQ
jgi:hypothetical protein